MAEQVMQTTSNNIKHGAEKEANINEQSIINRARNIRDACQVYSETPPSSERVSRNGGHVKAYRQEPHSLLTPMGSADLFWPYKDVQATDSAHTSHA